MTTTRLYQMYDRTAQTTAGPIISEKSDNSAIRAFHTVLDNDKTLPGQYPDDFELRFLGQQDEETTVILPLLPPLIIATGIAWKDAQIQQRERQRAREDTH